jgi:hypothetical protein
MILSWKSEEPSGTKVKFKLRSADDEVTLASKDYIGPDGSLSSYYTTSPSNIWEDHYADKCIQYKLFFVSTGEFAAELEDVTLIYNAIPGPPELVEPSKSALVNNSKPKFSWKFIDEDGVQAQFQVLIDDSYEFTNPDYDSGVQISSVENWEFPEGTSYSEIVDGDWYWKVRTKDSDGDLSPYSTYRYLQIDATPPLAFQITVELNGVLERDLTKWISPDKIGLFYSTTDETSGISHYEARIDNGLYEKQSSPYILTKLTDGGHTVTVRAYDMAGNYRESIVELFIDTTPPEIEHVPISKVKAGEDIVFNANVTDEHSGVDSVKLYIKNKGEKNYTVYKMESVDNTYTKTLSSSDFITDIEYFIEASDKTKPPNIVYFDSDGIALTKPTVKDDIDIDIDVDDDDIIDDPDKIKKGEGDDKSSSQGYLLTAAGIIIVIVIVLLIWILFLRRRGGDESLVSGASQPVQYQQQGYPQYPQQTMPDYFHYQQPKQPPPAPPQPLQPSVEVMPPLKSEYQPPPISIEPQSPQKPPQLPSREEKK